MQQTVSGTSDATYTQADGDLLIENGLGHFLGRSFGLSVPDELDAEQETHPANLADVLVAFHHPERNKSSEVSLPLPRKGLKSLARKLTREPKRIERPI